MKRSKLFSLRQVKWLLFLGVVVVVGSVMAYGLIGTVTGAMASENAITMLGMIPVMLAAFLLACKLILRGMERRMGRLVDGIHAVADGDLDYQIDLTDAGEYETLYREFNAMARELGRTRQEMESFTNEFAHEFKTPITSISGFARYLYETGAGAETAERMEYLKIIAQQSDRLCRLSQNTLLLSKISAMEIVTDRETYDLGEQLRKCVILLDKSITAKRITVELPENFDTAYTGNRELLEHVWINLLNNAVKFTPEGGIVTIRCQEDGEAASVSVADTGPGMDAETQTHIFEKFYQHDTTSLTKGNGIGLAIVKRAVELSGGTVSVASAPGKGSTFTVTLPKN